MLFFPIMRIRKIFLQIQIFQILKEKNHSRTKSLRKQVLQNLWRSKKELATYSWIQWICLGKSSNSLNNTDFITDHMNFSWWGYSFVTIIQTLILVSKSVMYILYANNLSINNTVTITLESINYKIFESVFINFLKNFATIFVAGYKDGMMVI